MHTNQNEEPEDCASADCASADYASADSLRQAYGRKVQDLLSQCDAATWIEDLWQMYTGYTAFVQESGYDPRGGNRFVSFRELVFFFQDVGKMGK
jgi:hypothetical protein